MSEASERGGSRFRPTCNVTVKYTPSAAGPQAVTAAIALCPLDAIAIVKDSDGNPIFGTCPTNAIVGVPFAVTGSGVAAETVTAGPQGLSFGSVTAQTHSEPQTVTLTNGTESTSITGLLKSGTGAQDFVIDTDSCTGAVLPPHATCTFDVTVHAVATGRARRDIGGGGRHAGQRLSVSVAVGRGRRGSRAERSRGHAREDRYERSSQSAGAAAATRTARVRRV